MLRREVSVRVLSCFLGKIFFACIRQKNSCYHWTAECGLYCFLGYLRKRKTPPRKTPEGANLLERATRFELATHGLGSRYSTTELRPHVYGILETLYNVAYFQGVFKTNSLVLYPSCMIITSRERNVQSLDNKKPLPYNWVKADKQGFHWLVFLQCDYIKAWLI